jgi:hypothetical protein
MNPANWGIRRLDEMSFNYLAFRLGSGDHMSATRFKLVLPVTGEWIKIIGRVRSGAAFPAPLLRGQTEITCEYCGLVTRL